MCTVGSPFDLLRHYAYKQSWHVSRPSLPHQWRKAMRMGLIRKNSSDYRHQQGNHARIRWSLHWKRFYYSRHRTSAATFDPSAQIMSSDDAYGSFLEQANQDTGASKGSATSRGASTQSVNTDVPHGLQSVEQYYSSEVDEPFEPVSLQWGGSNMPSERTSDKMLLRSSFDSDANVFYVQMSLRISSVIIRGCQR